MDGILELEANRNPRLKLFNDLGLSEDSKALSCPVVQNKSEEGLHVPRLKRIGRHLIEAERVVWHFRETDEEPTAVETFVDSDWAGCLTSWKSTSGGMLSVAGTSLKSWSNTRKRGDVRCGG